MVNRLYGASVNVLFVHGVLCGSWVAERRNAPAADIETINRPAGYHISRKVVCDQIDIALSTDAQLVRTCHV